jgi:3-isopropylmalate/(R)-2-methylmalate dehydratase small subunit
VLECEQAGRIPAGAEVALDLEAAAIRLAGGETLRCAPIPGFLLDILRAGGLLNQLERRLAAARERKPA